MVGPPTYPGMPGWLKRSAMAVGIAALLLVILVHAGGGPSHHVPFVGSLGHPIAHEAGR